MATDVNEHLFSPFSTCDGPSQLDMMLAIFVENGTAEHPRNLHSFSTVQHYQGRPVKFTFRGYLLGAERTGDAKNETFKYQFLVLKGLYLGVDATGRMLSGVHNVRNREGQAHLGSLPTPTFEERGNEIFAIFDTEVPSSLDFIKESLAVDGYRLVAFERGEPQSLSTEDLVIALNDWNGKGQDYRLVWVEPTRKYYKNVSSGSRTFLPGTRFLVHSI